MASSIGWLDRSEEQQRSMREVIALFAETGTIDDLGLGTVRDAFSDLLFPGLSTVQTRVRYFLILPWVYQRLDTDQTTSKDASTKSRQWEIELIESLMRGAGEDPDGQQGIIGQEARSGLKQLPSFIYWSGAQAFGIRTFVGSRSDYFGTIDRSKGGRSRRVEQGGDQQGGDEPGGADTSKWHANVPEMPADLWETATLELRYQDAAYLQERMIASQPDSLLAHLLKDPAHIADDLPFSWDAVDLGAVPSALATKLRTAQFYSEAIHGAQLLYNLMLAELAADRELPKAQPRLENYQSQLADWQNMVAARRDAHQATSTTQFWEVVSESGATVTWPTRRFVTTWLDAVHTGVDVANSTELRRGIKDRERKLKKAAARLHNPRTLETWGGAAGANRFAFRWDEGRSAVNDIAAGLALHD